MSNATGMRDHRLKLYARVNKGSDGHVSPSFVLSVTRWGRLDERSSLSRDAQSRMQQQTDGVAQFSDEVTPPVDGIIVDQSGAAWWIRGIVNARATRAVIVYVDRVKHDEVSTLTMVDAETPLGGVHVVNP